VFICGISKTGKAIDKFGFYFFISFLDW